MFKNIDICVSNKETKYFFAPYWLTHTMFSCLNTSNNIVIII